MATCTWLLGVYRKSFQYVKLYDGTLSFADFLREDLGAITAYVRSEFLERQQEAAARQRQKELSAALSDQLQKELRSLQARISDPEMQQKIQEYLSVDTPAIDRMKLLLEEAHELSGRKTPAERLVLLLDSLKPYCSEEEFTTCQREAND